jgi:hypothetical protein
MVEVVARQSSAAAIDARKKLFTEYDVHNSLSLKK